MRRALTLSGLTALLVLVCASPALAAGVHPVLVPADIPIVGSIWHSITGAVVGAFSWTTKLAATFILNTLGGFIKLLIPRSWAHDGLQVMQWLVAVPNYAGQISTPGGGHAYGFPGINDLRELFEWIGIAIAPLTVVYATSRAMIGEGEPVGLPIIRMAGVAALVASYPWWWSQASALVNQITAAILGVPAVANGLDKLMEYAVLGVALGGWQLIDLGTMAAIGLELLAMIFVKVAIILLGAVLYATGPVMIGMAPTRSGHAVARAWITAAVTLLGLGIMWATLLAVGALLINDAGSAGPLVAGNTTFGSLMGGLLLAVAGAVTLWLCIKAAREAVSLLRLQFGSMLAVTNDLRSGAKSTTAITRERTTGASLREYASRGTRAAGAAASASGVSSDGRLAAAGGYAGSIGGSAMSIGRRGLIGTAAVAAGSAVTSDPVKRMLSRTRAGEAAVKMAKAGSANWASTGASGGSERVGTMSGNDAAANGGGAPTRHQAARRTPAAEAQRAGANGQQPSSAAAQAGKPTSKSNASQAEAQNPVASAGRGSPTNTNKRDQPASSEATPETADGRQPARRSSQRMPATRLSDGAGQPSNAAARPAGPSGARSSNSPGTGAGRSSDAPAGNPQGDEQAGPTARRRAQPATPAATANPSALPTTARPGGPASKPPTDPRATSPAPGSASAAGTPGRERPRSRPPSASSSSENAAPPPRSKPPVQRIRPARQPDRNQDA